MQPDDLIDFLIENPVDNTSSDEPTTPNPNKMTDKITPKQTNTTHDDLANGYSRIIRYLQAQQKAQDEFNQKTFRINTSAMIFSAIAAIGTIASIIIGILL